MRLADRYLLRELTLPFLIGVLSATLLLTVLRLSQNLDQIVRDRWPAEQLVRTIAYDLPMVLVMGLPVATALAVSLAVSRLARDNEITVLRGAGAPLGRLFLPLAGVGIAMSLLNLYLADRVVPRAWKASQQLLQPSLARDVEGGRTLRAGADLLTFATLQRLSATRLRLEKIVLVRASGVTIVAPSALYENGVFTFATAVTHRYGDDGIERSHQVQSPLRLPLSIDFSPNSFALSDEQLRYLSFDELTRGAQEARRRGERRRAIELETNRWFKLALPAMCLPLALCAAPLALRFSRAGSFAGVLLSLLCVFVGWNTLLLFQYLSLGGYRLLPPLVAAWSTHVAFILAGLALQRSQD